MRNPRGSYELIKNEPYNHQDKARGGTLNKHPSPHDYALSYGRFRCRDATAGLSSSANATRDKPSRVRHPSQLSHESTTWGRLQPGPRHLPSERHRHHRAGAWE